jgi:hypothetical protein
MKNPGQALRHGHAPISALDLPDIHDDFDYLDHLGHLKLHT